MAFLRISLKEHGKLFLFIKEFLKIQIYFFQFCRYFNRTHKKVFYDLNNDFSNSELEISSFYFLHAFCIEINLKITFEEADFYFLDSNRNVIGIYFNSNFTSKKEFGFIYFLFRESGTNYFSESFAFSIKNRRYEISFEHVEIIEEDKFELLKSFKNWSKERTNLNNATKYAENLKATFRSLTNLTTRSYFLKDKDELELEIDDEIFEQFILQIQNEQDNNGFTSVNSRKNVYNSFNQVVNSEETGFVFSVSLSKRITIKTNQDNNMKLVITILNSTSLWFDLCILNLIVYIKFILCYFLKIFQFLIRLKIYLKLMIRKNSYE